MYLSEDVQYLAGRSDPRTTQIYDRRRRHVTRKHRGACLDMKEEPEKRDILSKPASKKAAARPRSAPLNEPKLVPVPLPEGVRHQRVGETTERSTPAHLKKLKQLFEAAPISRYLGMTLGYCENGVARVRLPFSSGAPAGRNGWFGGEVCSGSPIAEPVPRRLVSANLENASRIRAFGSVRIFGHDAERRWTVQRACGRRL